MECEDLECSLADMFEAQATMEEQAEILDLKTVEDLKGGAWNTTLLVKPIGFRLPPIKVISNHLTKIWKTTKGLKIHLSKAKKDVLTCCFNDRKDMEEVENYGSWVFRGAHMMIERWGPDRALEEVKFNHIIFWIQLRGIRRR